MRTFAALFCATLAACVSGAIGVRAADTGEAAPRLTVELRDGSRVVGQSVAGKIKFRSALLGDLKLNTADIRSVEFTATNAAKLTAANGDVLLVQADEKEIPVRTSFGKVELAVDSIRKISVTAGHSNGNKPSGLVALWSGEDNGDDMVGGNKAIWNAVTYAEGKVGHGFLMNHFGCYAHVPASDTLNIGKGEGFTIAVWIKPDDVNAWHPLLEWNDGTGGLGVHLWIGEFPSDQGVLFANVINASQQANHLRSPMGTLQAGRFQFIALTYDKTSGQAALYVDGKLVSQNHIDQGLPETSYDLWIGRRPSDHPGDSTYRSYYSGVMDEISLYNRALSADEIKSLSEK
jgi:Concanavalin A-like lectin/glucanases superfamily